jgi:hypothetical protein
VAIDFPLRLRRDVPAGLFAREEYTARLPVMLQFEPADERGEVRLREVSVIWYKMATPLDWSIPA